jgi:hypothetical protein
VLISYNEPEDLPGLARARGETFYHYFGPQWGYAKDANFVDWRVLADTGFVYAGRAGEGTAQADLTVYLAAAEPAAVSIYRADGRPLLERIEVGAEARAYTARGLALGRAPVPLLFRVESRPDGARHPVMVHSVLLRPAGPPPEGAAP